MTGKSWPDPLQHPEPARVAWLLEAFWQNLDELPALLQRQEHLLAAECIASLRALILEMMLALNGIRRPERTRHLNTYLSDSQRAALEKTLLVPRVNPESWIGHAVALVVIYRWYAPQLVDRYQIPYPQAVEQAVWQRLERALPDWPRQVRTD